MKDSTKNIERVFTDSLSDLKSDAKAAGLSLSAVCKQAGVARATPDRWALNPPKTIRTLAKMQDIVAEKAAQQSQDEGEAGQEASQPRED